MSMQRFKSPQPKTDFDLDAYLERKANEPYVASHSDIEKKTESSFRKNVIALGIFLLFAAVWLVTGGPLSVFNFGDEGVQEVNRFTTATPPPPSAPDVRVSEAPSYNQIQTGYLEYLQQIQEAGFNYPNTAVLAMYNEGLPIAYLEDLQEAGLLDVFSYSAIIGLYSSNVPISYLTNLQNAGLIEEFSYSAIIGLYSSNVPISYLTDLQNAGLIEEFSYSAIIGLYSSNVPISYLTDLQNAGLIEEFSYSAIIGLYNSNVPISYLTDLQNAGLIEEFSYSAIIGLNSNNVPVSYIQTIYDRGLLETMSYNDIITAFQADN